MSPANPRARWGGGAGEEGGAFRGGDAEDGAGVALARVEQQWSMRRGGLRRAAEQEDGALGRERRAGRGTGAGEWRAGRAGSEDFFGHVYGR